MFSSLFCLLFCFFVIYTKVCAIFIFSTLFIFKTLMWTCAICGYFITFEDLPCWFFLFKTCCFNLIFLVFFFFCIFCSLFFFFYFIVVLRSYVQHFILSVSLFLGFLILVGLGDQCLLFSALLSLVSCIFYLSLFFNFLSIIQCYF